MACSKALQSWMWAIAWDMKVAWEESKQNGGGGDTAAAVATMRRLGSNACLPKQPDDVPSQRWPGQGHTNVNLFWNHCVTCSRNIRGNLTAFDDDTMGGWRWSDSIVDATTSCGGVITHLIQSSANLHPQGAYVTRGMDGSKWTGTIDTCLRVRDTYDSSWPVLHKNTWPIRVQALHSGPSHPKKITELHADIRTHSDGDPACPSELLHFTCDQKKNKHYRA